MKLMARIIAIMMDRGATSCSISGGIDIKGGGASAACDVSCQTGYYACCGIRCTCEKY